MSTKIVKIDQHLSTNQEWELFWYTGISWQVFSFVWIRKHFPGLWDKMEESCNWSQGQRSPQSWDLDSFPEGGSASLYTEWVNCCPNLKGRRGDLHLEKSVFEVQHRLGLFEKRFTAKSVFVEHKLMHV